MGAAMTARALADDLAQRILDGDYAPGDTLPRQADFARERGVNVKTVQAAYGMLAARGLVAPIRRRGTVVLGRPPIRRLGIDRYNKRNWKFGDTPAFIADRTESGESWARSDQTQTVEVVDADADVAAALGLPEGEPVVERARVVRDSAGKPTHSLTSYYRTGDVDGTPLMDPSPGPAGRGGGFSVLTLQGLEPHAINESIRARLASTEEARDLELQAGEPVVVLTRTTRTADGLVVEYARGVHAAYRFEWTYDFEIPDTE